jgi:hypothetical protein
MNDEHLRRQLTQMRVELPDAAVEQQALEHALDAFHSRDFVGASDAPRDVSTGATTPWSWRDWLWPSPYLWGACAAVWITLLAVNSSNHFSPDGAASNSIAANGAPSDPQQPPLFARNDYQALLREFKQLSATR